MFDATPERDPQERDRRVLIVGVQKYLDAGMALRPGTTAALRRIGELLGDPERGGWTVEVLLDDEPEESRRPMLANLLERLQWLNGADEALLLLSGRVRSGLFLPRDARPTLLSRTAISLGEIAATLPKDASVIVDAPVDGGAFPTASWVLAAGPRDGSETFPTPRGPTAFLSAVQRALLGELSVSSLDETSAPAPPRDEGVTARRMAELVVQNAWPAWMRGERDLQLTRGGRRGVTCVRCAKPVADPLAAYCPACGHPLKGPETLEGGRYRILRPLGTGGMGTVYLAEDTRLNVQRALKVLSLPPGLSQSDEASFRARLVQECKAAQALAERTGHCVRVFDVGHSPERGEPFLVMELLQGRTLADKLAEGRLDLQSSLQLGRTLAETLGIAHAQGIVHRDLKPENVFLHHRSVEEPEFAKLLDFGIAKVAEADVKTQTGRVMGTLQYMPPEQLKGEAVDARADVFALGAVLYECLSGERAVPGRTQSDIFRVLLDTGVISLRERVPDAPPALVALVDRCLALDPKQRPANAAEVARAISEIVLALEAEHAMPTSVEREAEAPTKGLPPSTVKPIERKAVDLPEVFSPVPDAPPSAKWGARAVAIPLGLLLAVGVAVWLGTRRAGEAVTTAGDAPAAASAATLGPDAGRDMGMAPTPLSAAAATVAATLPARRLADLKFTWPGAPSASLRVDGDWIVYADPTPEAQWGRLVVDVTLADEAPPATDARAMARWSRMAAPVRAWLARPLPPQGPGIVRRDPERLAVLRDVFDALRALHRPSEIEAPGLGRLLARGADLVFERVRCGEAREGDRLFTAEWSTPGYTPGRCEAADCGVRLARGLLQARNNGETAQVKLELQRGEGEVEPTERVRASCAVVP